MSLYRSFVDKPLPPRSLYRELAGMAHGTTDEDMAHLSQAEVDALLRGANKKLDDAPPDIDFWIRHYERELSDIDDMARIGECRKREIGHFINVLKGLK